MTTQDLASHSLYFGFRRIDLSYQSMARLQSILEFRSFFTLLAQPMSGYDKLPDYGDPPVTWRFYTVIAAVVVGFVLALFWLRFA